MEKINSFKAFITALSAAATAFWGWMGWTVAALIICLALDYITGTAAAGKAGEWDSSMARLGILHKLGTIVTVGAAGITDLVISQLLSNVPISLPFTYTVAICPLVVVWYIVTELGSILENCEKLGVPIPPFFRRVIALCKNGIEKAGGSLSDSDSNPGSGSDAGTGPSANNP